MSNEIVVIVRPGAVGDAVLTLPVVAALRQAAKKVLIIGTPASWAFLAQNTHGVRVSDFGGHEWHCLFADDSKPSPESLKDLNQATAIVNLASGGDDVAAKLRIFGVKTVRVCAPPLADEATPTQEPKHAAARLMTPLSDIITPEVPTVTNDAIKSVLEIESKEFAKRMHDFQFFTKPYVVLHPGSGGAKKCWVAERYAELATRIADAQVLPIVVFGPADDATRERFENAITGALNLARVENEKLRNVLALMAGARGYAGNDSGMSHLAARICPTTALFGPTDPAVWAPLGEDVNILRAADGNLDSISVDTVLESVLR